MHYKSPLNLLTYTSMHVLFVGSLEKLKIPTRTRTYQIELRANARRAWNWWNDNKVRIC